MKDHYTLCVIVDDPQTVSNIKRLIEQVLIKTPLITCDVEIVAFKTEGMPKLYKAMKDGEGRKRFKAYVVESNTVPEVPDNVIMLPQPPSTQ